MRSCGILNVPKTDGLDVGGTTILIWRLRAKGGRSAGLSRLDLTTDCPDIHLTRRRHRLCNLQSGGHLPAGRRADRLLARVPRHPVQSAADADLHPRHACARQPPSAAAVMEACSPNLSVAEQRQLAEMHGENLLRRDARQPDGRHRARLVDRRPAAAMTENLAACPHRGKLIARTSRRRHARAERQGVGVLGIVQADFLTPPRRRELQRQPPLPRPAPQLAEKLKVYWWKEVEAAGALAQAAAHAAGAFGVGGRGRGHERGARALPAPRTTGCSARLPRAKWRILLHNCALPGAVVLQGQPGPSQGAEGAPHRRT